jgi:hypothetical protein
VFPEKSCAGNFLMSDAPDVPQAMKTPEEVHRLEQRAKRLQQRLLQRWGWCIALTICKTTGQVVAD